MNELRYSLPGRPKSWQRDDIVNGKRVTGHQNRAVKDAHRYAALSAGARVQACDSEGSYELHMVAHYPNRVQGDCDRLLGLPLDALQGLVYRDDRQVVRVSCERRIDRENPRVEIVVRKLPEAE